MGSQPCATPSSPPLPTSPPPRPDGAAEVRYCETSMKDCFGLSYLHKFFSVPFLQMQVGGRGLSHCFSCTVHTHLHAHTHHTPHAHNTPHTHTTHTHTHTCNYIHSFTCNLVHFVYLVTLFVMSLCHFVHLVSLVILFILSVLSPCPLARDAIAAAAREQTPAAGKPTTLAH